MTIEFIKDDGWFAIVTNGIWKGKMYTELLFAELDQVGPSSWAVRFEDDYSNPSYHNSLEEAKKYVSDNFMRHIPHCNSTGINIDEL